MFITRKEHDEMLKLSPMWMSNVWAGITKTWSIEGVRLNPVEDGTADEVRMFLKMARNNLKGR